MIPIDEYLNSINSESFYPSKNECDKYISSVLPTYGRLINHVDKVDNYGDLPKFNEELPENLPENLDDLP